MMQAPIPEPSAMSIQFLVTTLIVVIAPGAGVLITLAAGLAHGRRASLVAAFGCTLGILPHMLAAITGLAALLHASSVAFQALKYAGAAYLLYMAWMALKDRSALHVHADAAPRSAWEIIRHAALVNAFNPKLSIFFLAFLPQFIGKAEAHPARLMLEQSAVFMAMTFGVFAVYGLCAATLRNRVLSRPAVLKWMRGGFAAVFLGLGLKLAIQR
jgi:threonine/homoserine/homoserine lactone efflux protein